MPPPVYSRVAIRIGFGRLPPTGAGRRNVKGEVTLTGMLSAFVAHHRLEVRFCNPYSGNEKGSVENSVGFLRRNLMVPPMHAESYEQPIHPTTRRHPRPLLLEPVAMPHAQRLPTGITQLADHIRSAALVPHIQLNRTPTLLLAVLRHGRFLLGSQSKKTAPPCSCIYIVVCSYATFSLGILFRLLMNTK